MQRIVFLMTPNTEEPLMYADVYKPDAENREDVPDQVTANHALVPGVQTEIVLEDEEYIVLHLDSSLMTDDPQFAADPQYEPAAEESASSSTANE